MSLLSLSLSLSLSPSHNRSTSEQMLCLKVLDSISNRLDDLAHHVVVEGVLMGTFSETPSAQSLYRSALTLVSQCRGTC